MEIKLPLDGMGPFIIPNPVLKCMLLRKCCNCFLEIFQVNRRSKTYKVSGSIFVGKPTENNERYLFMLRPFDL